MAIKKRKNIKSHEKTNEKYKKKKKKLQRDEKAKKS